MPAAANAAPQRAFRIAALSALLLCAAASVPAASLGYGFAGAHVHDQFTGSVVPLTFSPGKEHYDFSLMWMDQQLLDRPEVGGKVAIVRRQWVLNAMRRWTLRQGKRLQPFLGFGVAWFSSPSCDGNPPLPDQVQPPGVSYTGCNHLLGSQLNFAEQVGLRWVLDGRNRRRLDFSVRHFSNANLTPLNRGQEMVQLTLSVDCRVCERPR